MKFGKNVAYSGGVYKLCEVSLFLEIIIDMKQTYVRTCLEPNSTSFFEEINTGIPLG